MLSSFQIELWTKYAVATAVMAFRFATRWRMVGWRNFDWTDFWCAISIALYTIVSLSDYLLSTPGYPTIIALTPETAALVRDEDIPLLKRGSKLAHFSWSMYICMLFTFKGAMLAFFQQVGAGIWEVQVFYASIFIVLCWIGSFLAHICGCLPIRRVWQVHPLPGLDHQIIAFCTTRPQNYYVAGALNMLTDFIIMIIPIPMLCRLRVNIRRRLALALLFGSGIFLIICAILRTIYALTDIRNIAIAQAWADREGFAGVIVIAAPGIWPLIRRSRWFTSQNRSNRERTSGRNGDGPAAPNSSRRWWLSSGRRRSTAPRMPAETYLETDNDDNDEVDYELSSCRAPGVRAEPLSTCGSEERIVRTADGSVASGKEGEKGGVMPIAATTGHSVEHEDAATGGGGWSSTSFGSRRSLDWVK